MKATGFATWQGSWKQGNGTVSTASAILQDQPYSYASRFDGAPGASPEELLATAHAACFNQALANNFGMLELVAQKVRTSMTVELGQDTDGRPAILGMHVTVAASVPGATRAQFEHCAGRARTNCTLSKVIRCDITMTATLLD
jgi:osmotically inducible protein OsmC